MTRVRQHLLRFARLALLPLLLAAFFLLVGTAPVEAAPIVVTTSLTEESNDDECSLFEAIDNANRDQQQHDDCAAGSGADTISFNIRAGLCPGGICTISQGLLYDISQPVTIHRYRRDRYGRSVFAPLTQSRTFTITRTPGAQSGTVRLTVKDACGDWPTFIGGGPNAW